MRIESVGKRLGLALSAAMLAACGGPSNRDKIAVNAMLAAQNFAAAEAHIEKVKEKEYGQNNMVLFYLDKGMVQHHAGEYEDSDASLEKAERRMEELFTRSVTKTAGTFLINDNTTDYAGEPFERALLNVVRALNYVFLGKPDEALVESRKVEIFLDELNRKIEARSDEEKSAWTYKDDAFARYLDSLLYQDAGKSDDARISMEAARQAYGWYPGSDLAGISFDPAVPAGRGEVVFIHYNGVAPRKRSVKETISWETGFGLLSRDEESRNDTKLQTALRALGIALAAADTVSDAMSQARLPGKAAELMTDSITWAYPKYEDADPVRIKTSEVRAEGVPGASVGTIVMEDIDRLARVVLRDRNRITRTRAQIRATVKFLIAKAAGEAVTRSTGDDMLGIITKVGSRIIASASEVADTRAWATLPAEIRVARLALPPGKQDIAVSFLDGSGAVVDRHVFKDVEVARGRRTYLAQRTAQ